MKTKKTKLAIFILILTTLSCQPPKDKGLVNRGMIPYNLKATMTNGGFEIAWQADVTGNISGYNIYASDHSLEKSYPDGIYPVDIKPVNHPVFPGDLDPSDGVEYYPAVGLENGKRYYLTVRTVYPDQTLSDPAKEIVVVPGPSGEIKMSERFKGENDGFSFERNKIVRADNSQNDLFFHVQNGSKYLASPTRLDGFLNQTSLIVLPYQGDYYEVKQLVNNGDDWSNDDWSNKDRVEISDGDWVLAKLASGKHALVNVSGFQHTANHSVTLKYYLCTLSGEFLF